MTSPRPPVKRRRRPFGVYAIILLALINQALIVLPYLLPYLSLAPELLAELQAELPPAMTGLPGETLAIVTTLIALIIIIGLWSLRRWAWVATMLVVGLDLTFGLWRYLQGNPDYLSMFLDVIVVFYMNQREVQNAFERRRRPTEARP